MTHGIPLYKPPAQSHLAPERQALAYEYVRFPNNGVKGGALA